MSSLIRTAEAISEQVSPDAAFGCVITLVTVGLILLFLLFFTLRHNVWSKPDL
jgi:hypothetical protein